MLAIDTSFPKLAIAFLLTCLFLDEICSQSQNDFEIISLVRDTINQEFNKMRQEKTVLHARPAARGRDRFTSVYMLQNFNHEDAKVRKMRNSAYVSLSTSKRFVSQSSIPFETYSRDRRIQDGFKAAFNCTGPPPIRCNRRSRFRTLDGSCNNLDNPRWGMSFTPQARYLSPDYEDGFDAPRQRAADGGKLPSVRIISNTVLNGGGRATKFNSKNTMMLMAWGQFLDHDLTFTPTPADEQDRTIDCCKEQNRDCFPIDIPKRDPHFRKTCMHFIRSSPTLRDTCVPGVREQVNQLTSFIDASNVYGSTKNQSDSLRSFRGGQLKVSRYNLPPPDNPSVCDHEPGDYCLKAGDGRINEVVHLGGMHTLFLRYHNIIARKLARLNRHWSDERTFQETRRIVGALMQKITYYDWLPIIISPRDMDNHCLNPSPHCTYNPSVDPSIKNVFSTAAFRFGHSMVGPKEAYFEGNFRSLKNETDIELTMNNPHMVLYKKGKHLPDLMRFVCSSKSAKTDRIIEPNLRNRLFQDKKGESFDLVSLNMQRGRDHGLQSYVKWREFCGLSPITPVTSRYFHNGRGGFVDHTYRAVNRMRRAYRHTDDIDLFPAALSETPLHGAQVGPTFSCILAKQFSDLKLGDRFWFESDDPVTGLTPGQIQAIRDVSFSKIVCESMSSKFIQADIFRTIHYGNPLYRCKGLPGLDLSQWVYRRNTRQYYWRSRSNTHYWE